MKCFLEYTIILSEDTNIGNRNVFGEAMNMTMRERIMEGKLFTDMCEGMPEEWTQAKKTDEAL